MKTPEKIISAEIKIDPDRSIVALADGTELSGSAGYANGDLWIWINNSESVDFLQLVTLFSDPKKTTIITYRGPGSIEDRWEGFTKLVTVQVNEDSTDFRLRRNN